MDPVGHKRRHIHVVTPGDHKCRKSELVDLRIQVEAVQIVPYRLVNGLIECGRRHSGNE